MRELVSRSFSSYDEEDDVVDLYDDADDYIDDHEDDLPEEENESNDEQLANQLRDPNSKEKS